MAIVDPITPTEILDQIIQPIEPLFGPDLAPMVLRLRVGMSRPAIGTLIATAVTFAVIIGSMRLQSHADDSLAPPATVAQEPAKKLKTSGDEHKDAAPTAKTDPTAATKPAAKTDPDARAIVVHVTDESGVPLPNARLHVAIWEFGGRGKYGNRDYTTNAEGLATVQRPRRLQILRMWPYKSGYVPQFVNFAEGTHEDGKSIPERYEFRLSRGTTLSGVVVDENGRPIPGVAVDVSVSVDEPRPWGKNPKPMISRWLTDDDFQDGSVTTNKDGKWSIHDAPAPGKEFEFHLKFTHKDYISDSNWGELQNEQGVTTEALRKGSAQIVLKSGTAVTGTVVDSSGKPVKQGLIIWSDDPYLAEGVNEAPLDGAGRFKTLTLRPGERSLTVLAPGFCPERRKVDIVKGMSGLQFTLRPGNRIKFKVVDQNDNPIPGAYVGIGGWQGAKSLFNEKHPNVPESHVPRKADKNGVYEWEWAPDDAVSYRVSAKGFETTTVELVASPVEQTVELAASGR